MRWLTRMTLLVWLWRRYGTRIRITSLYMTAIFVTQLVHDEFLLFVKLSDSLQYLGLSFVVKWSIQIVLLMGCCLHYKKGNLKARQVHLVKQSTSPFAHLQHCKTLQSRGDTILYGLTKKSDSNHSNDLR